jgi:muconolactone delta-isomerase
MAKKSFKEEVEAVKAKVETKVEAVKEMSAEEARKWRASLAKASDAVLSENQLREAWRVYWAQAKSKWANSSTKNLEQFIWLHLKSVKMASPTQFEAGIKHFGLKKVS